MLASWQFEQLESGSRDSCIGHFNATTKVLRVLHRLGECVEVVQASVNSTISLLAYVVKRMWSEDCDADGESEKPKHLHYFAHIVEIREGVYGDSTLLLKHPSRRQVMVQFLWRTDNRFDKVWQDKLLVLVHGISTYL